MRVTLTADLGTSRVKVGLLDEAGSLIDLESLPGPAAASGATGEEVDAEVWWSSFAEGVRRLAGRQPAAFADVAAVALGGVTRTQVLVGADGRPIGPALGWADVRSADVAAELRDRLHSAHPEAGAINAFHPLARLAWLARAAPHRLQQAAAVVDPKDMLVARLTGHIVSDPISMARLAACAVATSPGEAGSLFAAAGVAPHLLAPLLPPGAVAGTVEPGHSEILDRLVGRPVLVGCHDTWLAVLGLGALRPGYAYVISGTSEVVGLISDRPVTADGLLTVDWSAAADCPLVQLGGPSQGGGDTLAWLAEMTGGHRPHAGNGDAGDHGTAHIAQLLAGPRTANPLLFLPFLTGERTPFWDPRLRGAMLGLDRRHGPTDLAWAALEGLAFVNRLVLERAEQAVGAPAQDVRLGGGLASLADLAQIKADILQRPVVVGAATEPGLVGAGLLAAASLYGAGSLTALQDRLAVGRRHTPDGRRASTYRSLQTLFIDAHAAVAPLSHRLAAHVSGS